jgi:hypothetical protein
MNMKTLRNGAVAGLAAVAIVSAGSLAAPTQAHANGKIAAALLGGALFGAIVASQRPAYGAPVYYAPTCWWQTQQVWHPYGGYYTLQKVQVCQ